MKRILTIAGSDSGGGAGIQTDIKTITVLGGYGMSVITALTAQNTVGVQAVFELPLDFIEKQMDSVIQDIGVDAVKTGMLSSPEIVSLVASKIQQYRLKRIVVDPVMVAKSGDSLLKDGARQVLLKELIPRAFVVTPNLPEASVLSGINVKDLDTMKDAARYIHDTGAHNVLVKGGGTSRERLSTFSLMEPHFTSTLDRAFQPKTHTVPAVPLPLLLPLSLPRGIQFKRQLRLQRILWSLPSDFLCPWERGMGLPTPMPSSPEKKSECRFWRS